MSNEQYCDEFREKKNKNKKPYEKYKKQSRIMRFKK